MPSNTQRVESATVLHRAVQGLAKSQPKATEVGFVFVLAMPNIILCKLAAWAGISFPDHRITGY